MTITPTLLALLVLAFALGIVAPPVWKAARRAVRKQRVRRELRRIQRQQTF